MGGVDLRIDDRNRDIVPAQGAMHVEELELFKDVLTGIAFAVTAGPILSQEDYMFVRCAGDVLELHEATDEIGQRAAVGDQDVISGAEKCGVVRGGGHRAQSG